MAHIGLPDPTKMLKFEYLKNLKMAALKIINFCPTEMTYTVSGGALNSTQTKPNLPNKTAKKMYEQNWLQFLFSAFTFMTRHWLV